MKSDQARVAEILDAYEVTGELGRGGWGVVLGGRHKQLGRRVAIKVLPTAFGGDPKVRSRFLAEARMVASLDHPHIIPIFDYVERDGLGIIVMEHLPGGTLWSHFSQAGVPSEKAVAYGLIVCTALQFAHDRGIVHRDVKPDNLMFNAEGVLKLGDFGIARVLDQAQVGLTATGTIVGTPAYMAPERVLGQKLGPESDIYATGVVLYELLSGRLPFQDAGDAMSLLYQHAHEAPRLLTDVAPHIPPTLERTLMRALEKAPEDRYRTTADFALALAEAATDAWGPGWLRRTGVNVMAAGEVIAATERGREAPRRAPTTIVTPVVEQHARLGAVVSPGPGPVSELEPIPSTTPAEVRAMGLAAPPTGEIAAPETSPVTRAETATPPESPAQAPVRLKPAPIPSAEKPRRRSMRWAALAVGLLVLVGGSVFVSSLVGRDSPDGQTGRRPGPNASRRVAPPATVNGAALTWTRVKDDSFGGSGDQGINTVAPANPASGLTLTVGGFSGHDAAMWFTADGGTWEKTTAGLGGPGDQTINSIAASETFTAVGSSQKSGAGTDAGVWTSTDGQTWRSVANPAFGGRGDQVIYRVTGGRFGLTAAGSDSSGGDADAAVWTFSSGNWRKSADDALGGKGNQVAHRAREIGGLLVLVGTDDANGDQDAAVWLSRDAINWQRVPDTNGQLGGPGDQEIFDVWATGNELVAGGHVTGDQGKDAALWHSADGFTWQRLEVEPGVLDGRGDQVIGRILVGVPGFSFFAMGSDASSGDPDAAIWSSSDGKTVRREAILGGSGAQTISTSIFMEGAIWAVGSDAFTGDADAAIWTAKVG